MDIIESEYQKNIAEKTKIIYQKVSDQALELQLSPKEISVLLIKIGVDIMEKNTNEFRAADLLTESFYEYSGKILKKHKRLN